MPRFSGARTVILYGSNFQADSVANIDGVPATSTTVNSSSQLTAVFPATSLWSVGTKLVTVTSVIAGGQTHGPTNYVVTQLAAIVWEFDPTVAGALVYDGSSNVTQVTDASGNNRHLTSMTATKPTRQAATMNGYDSFRCATSSVHAYGTGSPAWFTSIGAWHHFTVMKPQNASTSDCSCASFVAVDNSGVSQSGSGEWVLGTSTGLVSGETWCAGKGGSTRLGATSANLSWTAGEMFVEEVLSDTPGGTILKKNGVAVSLTLGTAGNYSPNGAGISSGNLALRSAVSGGPAGYIDRGRTVICNAIQSAAVAQQIRMWCAHPYAVGVS